MNNDIFTLLQNKITEYNEGDTQISEYVSFNLKDTVNKEDAYYFSKFKSGDRDSQGKKKSFKNIVKVAVNVWYRATAIASKDILIPAGSNLNNVLRANLATIKFQEWVKKSNFDLFLKLWGLDLAKHGSSLVKGVKKDGQLYLNTVDWNNLIVDPVDINNAPIIEKLILTPADIQNNPVYNKKQVKELLSDVKNDDKQLITIYEIHGYLPKSYITGKKKDENKYSNQVHIVSFTENYDNNERISSFNNYILYQGEEKQSPYVMTHLLPENGRVKGIGAIETLFENQEMINKGELMMGRQLDIASKLFFQTSSTSLQGKNIEHFDTGEIIITEDGKPLTEGNNSSHDIGTIESWSANWQNNGQANVGVSESMMGITPPARTAWRQTQALLQENHSLFNEMTNVKIAGLKEIMRKFILPYIQTQLDTKEEIIATLEDVGIKKLDKMFLIGFKNKVMNEIKLNILKKGGVLDDGMIDENQVDQAIQNSRQQFGNVRAIGLDEISNQTWKDYFKDFVWDMEISILNEDNNAQGKITTYTTILNAMRDPTLFQDPRKTEIFYKLLANTGLVSPLEVSAMDTATQPLLQTQPMSSQPLPVTNQ